VNRADRLANLTLFALDAATWFAVAATLLLLDPVGSTGALGGWVAARAAAALTPRRPWLGGFQSSAAGDRLPG
jgi:hypothetical protein